ncbi:ParB/RepB/Spo0J family partition protein [candidate division CSSED10-310 bacterium]|uniref:ParB/RepB/Spo0J family partition protein n=1 Tax=candidate division CSSED10-310 bacterium TaxID=2855610 RepID=A0ABV6YS04_UNCC1
MKKQALSKKETSLSLSVREAITIPWGKPETISLESIHFPEKERNLNLYLLFARTDIRKIKQSINKIGLTTPVYLARSEAGYSVVSGFKRLAALKASRWKAVDAYTVSHGAVHARQLFLFRLFENIGHRVLNEFEKALIINTLIDFGFHLGTIGEELSPLINVPPRTEYLHNLHQITTLSIEALRLLASGGITTQQAMELARFKRKDRKLGLTLLKYTKWNNKEFSEIVTLLGDIAARDGAQYREIIQNTGIEDVLRDEKQNKREKGKNIQRILKQKRYPILQKHEQMFLKKVKSLRLPPSISLQAPAHFEGTFLRLLITCKTYQQLLDSVEKLEEIKGKSSLKELFTYF